MVTSIACQKGGTGKTSTSISLSAGLAKKGKKILLIDMDSQANASKVIIGDKYSELQKEETLYSTIIERKPLPIRKTYLKNLDIVPSHILLSDTDIHLTTAIDHREARLKTQLDKIKKNYDHIFIDCPPALSWLTINAFTASSEIIVVISPGYFELDSTVQIMRTIIDVRDNFNDELKLKGFLFAMADGTNATKLSLSLLRQTYPNNVFNTVINKNTDIRDASMAKQDIFSFNSSARAASDYERLINELFFI